MIQTTTAIYENGLLRPIAPLDLPEHAEVEITIQIGENPLHQKVRKALKLEKLSKTLENPVSNKRRAELAEIFSAEKPLADYINEDRDER